MKSPLFTLLKQKKEFLGKEDGVLYPHQCFSLPVNIWVFYVTMETCVEFSKALNIVKVVATLSKKEEPRTDGQEAGMFPSQIRIRFHPLVENCILSKSDADFFLLFPSICCLNVLWFICRLQSNLSMISRFIRRKSRPFMSWTSVFVPLWDTDDLELAEECDIWLCWLEPIVIQLALSHANVCAITTHLVPIEALPHQRAMVYRQHHNAFVWWRLV